MTQRDGFKRILVSLDATGTAHPVLAQALDLAARVGAGVKVVDVVPDLPPRARHYLPADVERDLVALRMSRLSAIVGSAGEAQVPLEVAVLRGSPPVALTREVIRGQYDLLMRSHGRPEADNFPPYGATDLQLLRQCPAAVWLVGPDATRPTRVLAAVHGNPEDRVETALNLSIIELGLAMASAQEGHLAILQAWTAWGEHLMRSRLPAGEFEEFVAAARRVVEQDVAMLTGAFGRRLGQATVELVKGLPEDAIPDFVEARTIDLVVMGTVARHGVAGWLMGNTAERVMRRLRCSLLAVKPPEFVSPVTLPDA